MSVLRQRMRTNELFKQYVVGEILDPSQVTDAEFTRQLLIAFDQKPYGSTRSELSDQFIIFLQRQAREGHAPLLVIDEGQCLSYDGLERLRIFLNYSLDDHRILQIIVFGQLELQEKIAKKRNLASRVRCTMTLEPLRSVGQVREMIEYRLRTAGLTEGIESSSRPERSRRCSSTRAACRAISSISARCASTRRRAWISARSTPKWWATWPSA